MTLKNIRTVLVHTSHPGNIGAAARALKTMGLHQLYLVAPEQFPHPDATARAAGGVDVLENAVVVDTLLEAVGDVQLVMATTSRHRTIERPILNPRAAAQLLIQEAAQRPVALLFGSEQHGLTNVELELCQFQVHIPAAADYGVLNLAAAVQVLAYEIHLASLDLMAANEHHLEALAAADSQQKISKRSTSKQSISKQIDTDSKDADATVDKKSLPTDDFATIAELESFYQHLEDVVQELGVLNPAQPRQLMQRLRVLFGRTRLDKTELNILRGILTAMQKRL